MPLNKIFFSSLLNNIFHTRKIKRKTISKFRKTLFIKACIKQNITNKTTEKNIPFQLYLTLPVSSLDLKYKIMKVRLVKQEAMAAP